METMSDLQKWMFVKEFEELLTKLPKNMTVRRLKQYARFEIKVKVQKGYYKNNVMQFLVLIPPDYNESVSL